MEDVQHFLQISETKWNFVPKNRDDTTELCVRHTYDNYLTYCESLYASFFTGKSTEVQQSIIENNFGVKKEQIQTWEERASRYKMTPESFTFFLHVAMYSAAEGYRRAKFVEDARSEFEAREQNKRNKSKSKKSKKNKKKKKRHVSDSDDSSVQNWQAEFDELTRNSDDDDIEFDDDRENIRNRPITKIMDLDPPIDQPIAESSGSKSSIVDQSLLHIIPEIEIIPSIVITPLPQQEKQSKQIMSLTKSSNQKKKSKINSIQNVITGHEPTGDGTSRVRDILVYDIPVSWTPEDILKQLTLWGKTISIQTKQQRKYQTLRLKIELSTFRLAQFEVNENPVWTTDLGGIPVRWFPARWTLKERKEREKFQATIRKIPDSMTLATLWQDQHPHSFLTTIKGLKSFKIIQTAKKERKLIGYFEKWVDMRAALDNQFVWENQQLSWNRHAPPTQRTRSQGNNADKNQRTSRSQKTEKTQQNSKNSKKKSEEAKSDKPKKQKKDKSRKESRSKVLAEILDLLRKIV